MTHKRILHITTLASLIALGIAANVLAKSIETNLGTDREADEYSLSARLINNQPRTIELQGAPFGDVAKSGCKYDHFTGSRMHNFFVISWGDGTISNLQSGPDGESCADIGIHTYDRVGNYDITVSIATLGNVDQMVSLYNGATSVTIK